MYVCLILIIFLCLWTVFFIMCSINLQITLTEFKIQKGRGSGTFLTRPVPLWFIAIYRSLIDFLFGCAASQLVTDIGKYSIGRLRPNFIDVCGPNIDFSNCSGQYNNIPFSMIKRLHILSKNRQCVGLGIKKLEDINT